jgi:hypothetical protein
VRQEKGDILYVPPWWLHETKVRPGKKNVGFNIHFGVPGQLTVHAADFANLVLGNPSFFYTHVRQPVDWTATCPSSSLLAMERYPSSFVNGASAEGCPARNDF